MKSWSVSQVHRISSIRKGLCVK